MIQIIYDKTMIEKCYLSPYVKICWYADGVILRQTVFNKVILIQNSKDALSSLLYKLEGGIKYADLYNLLWSDFNEMDPDGWIGLAFRSGVIE